MPATTLKATSASMPAPYGIAADSSGNLYVSSNMHSVFKVTTDGLLSRVAGTGIAGFSGDGGRATQAQLNAPRGLALDRAGNLYIADSGNQRVRKVSPAGTISTAAGPSVGTGGFWTFKTPSSVAVDQEGTLYVADPTSQIVFGLPSTGGISPAWSYGPCHITPTAIAIDSAGDVYVSSEDRILKGSPKALCPVTLVAGGGDSDGDNGPATKARNVGSSGMAFDASGNLYLALGTRVRKIGADGIITTFAGRGSPGELGDGGPAFAATLWGASGVTSDPYGNVYIADQNNNRVRKVTSSGAITTIAGGRIGDGQLALFAQFSNPGKMVRDSAGNLFIADTGQNRIRKIGVDGVITTVAGTGEIGFSGDGGPAVNANLYSPQGIALDSQDNLYIADRFNHRVRKVTKDGLIHTVAGDGVMGFKTEGDGGPAVSAHLGSPRAVAVDKSGNLYIAVGDYLRKVGTDGKITTFAGGGSNTPAFSDGGPATKAFLNSPSDLAFDAAGNLYVAAVVLRKISSDGIIDSVKGSSQLLNPTHFAMDNAGNFYVAEAYTYRVRKIAADGAMTTVIGDGKLGYSGDGGLAAGARSGAPGGLLLDSDGRLLMSDTDNHVIRMLTSASLPNLAVKSSHTGDFERGKTATYSITISNALSAGSANVPITATEIPPAGFTLVSMSGPGWSCAGNTCSRSDALAPGTSYPLISATVAVPADAPDQVTNTVTTSIAGYAIAGGLDLTAIAAPSASAPLISSVVDGAAYRPGVVDGSWASIIGRNLATSTRPWNDSDFTNGSQLPTSLDGVSVTIDGRLAAISYISPTQLNIQVPQTDKDGPVQVIVITRAGASAPASVEVRSKAPNLFAYASPNSRYPAALIARSDGGVDYLCPEGLFGAGLPTRPARPGETILLYGTGFGPTTPRVGSGQVFSGAARIVGEVSVTIGGAKATVQFAGLISPGLYQLNVVVPAVAAGDQPLGMTVDGVSAQTNLVVPVGR